MEKMPIRIKLKNFILKCDDSIMTLVIKHSNSFLDSFYLKYTYFGSWLFSLTISVFLVLFSSKTKVIGYEMVAASLFASIIVNLSKLIFKRSRPYWIASHLNRFNMKQKDYSFPSGHTTAAFSIATILTIYFPNFSFIFYLFASLVGVSRIYLRVHFPSDVCAGIILGVSTSLLSHFYLFPYLYKIIF